MGLPKGNLHYFSWLSDQNIKSNKIVIHQPDNFKNFCLFIAFRRGPYDHALEQKYNYPISLAYYTKQKIIISISIQTRIWNKFCILL
jgi:hypothetical protein